MSTGTGTPAAERLDALRRRIEQMDRDLVALVAQRVEVARQIGSAKRELDLPVLDPAREAAVIRRAGELAREAGVDAEEVRGLFWHLIGLSRRAQQEGG